MLSLVLDSANKELLVAIFKDDKKIDETRYEAWQRQSEFMLPELDKILKKNNVDPKSIDEIIVTVGPGSYTGVRIALTIAKIYAYTLNIPCYAISSLSALENPTNTSICLINARSGRSYFAVYKKGEAIVVDTILSNGEVLNYIEEHKNYSLCGDLSYLDLVGEDNDISSNLIALKSESNLVENIFTLKAVYLKD